MEAVPPTPVACSDPDKLSSYDWYHGLLPREDIQSMFRNNGDFLVRMSEPSDFISDKKPVTKASTKSQSRSSSGSQPGVMQRQYILSVLVDRDNDLAKHFVINKSSKGKFYIERDSFDSIGNLVEHYRERQVSITLNGDVVLKRFICRREWQLEHADIECTKKLGSGAFGDVYRGLFRLTTKTVEVAIKLAKLEIMTKEQIRDIMREARIMRDFNHPNVIRLYGVAATQEPLMLVMELASNGALDSYLTKNEICLTKKMQMCLQAAWGVEYIHEREVIHRDIAARNCLYGDGNVKISDFGLSRVGKMYQMDPRCKVPIRWLSPETLRTAKYTAKTDVWSYGIMCWEILHSGKVPYHNLLVSEVHVKVKEGYRMPIDCPGLHPDFAAVITSRCWAERPDARFTMSELARAFEALTKTPRPIFEEKESAKDRKERVKGSRRRNSFTQHSKSTSLPR